MHRRASRHRYSLLRSRFPGTRKNGPCFGRISLCPQWVPLVGSRRSVNKITTARVFSQTRAESSSSSSSPSASSYQIIRARDRHFMGVLNWLRQLEPLELTGSPRLSFESRLPILARSLYRDKRSMLSRNMSTTKKPP